MARAFNPQNNLTWGCVATEIMNFEIRCIMVLVSFLLRFSVRRPTSKSTEPISTQFELLGPLGITDLTFVGRTHKF
jgi:hypothetical protein